MANVTIRLNNISNLERQIYKALRLNGHNKTEATFILLGFYNEISELIIRGENIKNFMLSPVDILK